MIIGRWKKKGVDKAGLFGYNFLCPVAGRYGGVAQLARALGSYPGCHRFKSSRRYHELNAARSRATVDCAAFSSPIWLLDRRRGIWSLLRRRPGGQAVKTPPFHGGNTGSSPVRVTIFSIWRLSSAGRALASHARGHRFEFCSLHQKEGHAERRVLLFGFRWLRRLHPSVIMMLGAAKPPLRNSTLRVKFTRHSPRPACGGSPLSRVPTSASPKGLRPGDSCMEVSL